MMKYQINMPSTTAPVWIPESINTVIHESLSAAVLRPNTLTALFAEISVPTVSPYYP